MNRSIRVVAILALLLPLVLIANLTRIQVVDHTELSTDARNKRVTYQLKSTERGMITAGGEVLAKSVPGADGFYRRVYGDDPAVFGPVIGYASDIYGLSGVEQSRNAQLAGTDLAVNISTLTQLFSDGPHRGASVELTLDPATQRTAYQAMTEQGYTGGVVAVRPSTGEILAMVSTPSFSPAPLADNDTAEGYWNELLAQDDAGKPLLNHATQNPLPPGSTFKVITTAAALTAGLINPQSPVTAAPQITLPGTNVTLENYGGSVCAGGGTTTVAVAFAQSCNTAFAEIGANLSAEDFATMAQGFGTTDAYQLAVPTAAGTIGDVHDASVRAQSAIGQHDVTMTVLENAMVAATVANGGVRMAPQLVSRVTGPNLEAIATASPKELATPITKPVADQLTELMRGSEQYSGGRADIASKTGTAEHGANSRESAPHTWYIAFMPDRDVAVAVLVENGGNLGQAATGATVAAPIGRLVLDAAAAAVARKAGQ
ncbi:penicillin-binding transpeptidase domain-containing protein [Corynebacterium choanae]|uniref:Penicillin-binding protein A n=1 Tax=Corynebacterium choanae TaxID=1862358 RepID=A0A3G6J334_9CORY|nr:penicillin-binding transpeptidase domain-containing protein [Corynebacterium choanae]AZA12465.1 Penicillin-binding protein A [Corynebacterium choanae]